MLQNTLHSLAWMLKVLQNTLHSIAQMPKVTQIHGNLYLGYVKVPRDTQTGMACAPSANKKRGALNPLAFFHKKC